MAGTAAWPSETEDTPATFSTACVRFEGWRDSMSSLGTMVVPLAGVASIVGAAPAVTITLSSAIGSTSMTTGPSFGIARTVNGPHVAARRAARRGPRTA